MGFSRLEALLRKLAADAIADVLGDNLLRCRMPEPLQCGRV